MSKKEIVGCALLLLALVFFIMAMVLSFKNEDEASHHVTTRGYVLLCSGIILLNT